MEGRRSFPLWAPRFPCPSSPDVGQSLTPLSLSPQGPIRRDLKPQVVGARATLNEVKGSGHFSCLPARSPSLLEISHFYVLPLSHPQESPSKGHVQPSLSSFSTRPDCLEGPIHRPPHAHPSLGWRVTTAKRRATLFSAGLQVTSHPPNAKSGSAAGRRAKLPPARSVIHRLLRASEFVRRGERHGLTLDRLDPAAGPAAAR